MRPQKTRNEIRCFCRRKPLLAVYGLDDRGQIYVHIKVYKAGRIYGEILVSRGDIQLRCRECMRWYKVRIVGNLPELVETPEPESVSEDNTDRSCLIPSDTNP